MLFGIIINSEIIWHATNDATPESNGFITHSVKFILVSDIFKTLCAFRSDVTILLTYITNKKPVIPVFRQYQPY